MRRATLQSLLGPALLLYLVADAASFQGEIDLIGALTALVAGVLTLTPRLLIRDTAAYGARSVAWLGLCLAIALVRVIAPHAMSLIGDLAHVLALSGATALLASFVPGAQEADREPTHGVGRTRKPKLLGLAAAVLGAAMGSLSVLPPLRALGQVFIAPAWWSQAPVLLFLLSLVACLFVQLARMRVSAPTVSAAHHWVLMGMTPAVLAACAALLTALGVLDHDVTRGLCAVGALLLVWGHGASLDPDRRLLAGTSARRGASFVLVVGLTLLALHAALVFFGRVRPTWIEPGMSDVRTLWIVLGALLFSAVIREPIEALVTRFIAPARGLLLQAISSAHEGLAHASRLESVAQITLSALRCASPLGESGTHEARALFYRIAPPCEIMLDAAGVAHTTQRSLHPEIERALRAQLGEILVRASLEAKIVREPPLRPLIAALVDLDALCVAPLIHDGDLEGVLIIPRAERKSALSLEELAALQGLSRHIAGFLAVLASDARAQDRAERARAAEQAEHGARELALLETNTLRRELQMLNALPGRDALEHKPLAYSAAMRALVQELQAAAEHRAPLWITAERGVSVETLARHIHERSAQAEGALIRVPCAALPIEEALALLCGTSDVDEAATALLSDRDGTLLLCDIGALAPDAQRALVHALQSDKSEDMPRVLASARMGPDELVQSGVLLQELAERFTHVHRAPPLRERREDLPSLVLLALDQACRALGRAPVGIDAEAQARLLAYAWPLNTVELQAVIERAVQACEGPRVTAVAIARALGESEAAARDELALDGTYERIERRVLKRALDRTGGNKSEAARLLGLPRTTFIDKLRRHGLDDRGGSSTPPQKLTG